MNGRQYPITGEYIGEGPAELTIPERVLTKSGHKEQGLILAGRLMENFSAVDSYVLLRQVGEIVDVAIGKVQPAVIEACVGQPQESGGAKVEARAKAAKWDYHGDGELARIERDIELLKEQKKLREKFLQALQETVAGVETGEVAEPAKKLKTDYTVAIHFPKEEN